MAPSVDQGVALAAPATYPDWHIWLSPSGRWFAARAVPLPDSKTGPMIISAESRDQLTTRLAEQPVLTGRCL
jgi:hypothetical protein